MTRSGALSNFARLTILILVVGLQPETWAQPSAYLDPGDRFFSSFRLVVDGLAYRGFLGYYDAAEAFSKHSEAYRLMNTYEQSYQNGWTALGSTALAVAGVIPLAAHLTNMGKGVRDTLWGISGLLGLGVTYYFFNDAHRNFFGAMNAYNRQTTTQLAPPQPHEPQLFVDLRLENGPVLSLRMLF